ncbi:MAG: hypothetical protein JSV32_06530 [Dehalococcoidia bacterium]|nr:MAG: hypothetical protein JSV32_06530 [Dehalococcoidia bacterium]
MVKRIKKVLKNLAKLEGDAYLIQTEVEEIVSDAEGTHPPVDRDFLEDLERLADGIDEIRAKLLEVGVDVEPHII